MTTKTMPKITLPPRVSRTERQYARSRVAARAHLLHQAIEVFNVEADNLLATVQDAQLDPIGLYDLACEIAEARTALCHVMDAANDAVITADDTFRERG